MRFLFLKLASKKPASFQYGEMLMCSVKRSTRHARFLFTRCCRRVDHCAETRKFRERRPDSRRAVHCPRTSTLPESRVERFLPAAACPVGRFCCASLSHQKLSQRNIKPFFDWKLSKKFLPVTCLRP